jgi:hypothetical protein
LPYQLAMPISVWLAGAAGLRVHVAIPSRITSTTEKTPLAFRNIEDLLTFLLLSHNRYSSEKMSGKFS